MYHKLSENRQKKFIERMIKYFVDCEEYEKCEQLHTAYKNYCQNTTSTLKMALTIANVWDLHHDKYLGAIIEELHNMQFVDNE